MRVILGVEEVQLATIDSSLRHAADRAAAALGAAAHVCRRVVLLAAEQKRAEGKKSECRGGNSREKLVLRGLAACPSFRGVFWRVS